MSEAIHCQAEPGGLRPVLREVDVLVAGGGPAGIAAALAAAREGARTLLVERYGYLGGMMTGSLVVAGRCVSSDYLGGNTLRLIVPCFATGQAPGAAAALAARRGVQPRGLSIPDLQRALLQQGVYLG